MKSHERIGFVLLLLCAGPYLSGCGFATYPDSFAAPEFEVYRLTTDAFPDWWRCSFERSGTVCEATVTRSNNGEYVLELAVSSNTQFSYAELSPEIVAELAAQESALFDLPLLPPRTLTVQEVDQLKALFGDLHINRHPSPFTLVGYRGLRLLRVHRWDDVQLGTHTRDGTMVDLADSDAIIGSLSGFVPADMLAP